MTTSNVYVVSFKDHASLKYCLVFSMMPYKKTTEALTKLHHFHEYCYLSPQDEHTVSYYITKMGYTHGLEYNYIMELIKNPIRLFNKFKLNIPFMLKGPFGGVYLNWECMCDSFTADGCSRSFCHLSCEDKNKHWLPDYGDHTCYRCDR
jgi:hypothetical protein